MSGPVQLTRKPVTIISGFLGAGKTTFLNALIRQSKERGRIPFIIENEFGQENIDSQLVVGADDGIFEFSNGCLCCDLNEDLFDLLGALWEKQAQFNELIIETTGIADPATVALPFLTNPSIARHYHLARVIGLVDAQLIELQLAETEEARKQISFSDILLVTKTEKLPMGHLGHIKTLLHHLNPFAIVLSGNKTEGYPLQEIDRFVRDQNQEHGMAAPEAEHIHEHHHHHHDITSLSFRFTEDFDLEELEFRLMVFLQLQSDSIYRVKGIVSAHGEHRKIIVQSVSHMLGVTEGQPWAEDEERTSRMVFIGKQLKAQGFEKMLNQCLYKGNQKSNSILK